MRSLCLQSLTFNSRVSQMATSRPPLPVVSSNGCRLRLADGRELIDGISSWWTACSQAPTC